MSYIVGGTEYPDPALESINMDLDDLQNIYKSKIQNYINAKKTAQEYYQWINDNNTPIEAIAYTTDEIIETICYNEIENGIISCLPLFVYLTYKTNDWIDKIDLETIIREYVKKDFEETLIEINSSSLDNYPGLKKFVEDNNITNNILLEQFSLFWKNDCILNIDFPTKERQLPEIKSLAPEEFFKGGE